MTTDGDDGHEGKGDSSQATTAEETLAALLGDLTELRDYLRERGRHTYELAQRFLENARRDASSRGYDERQATMLEYQHYIWHEIAGFVEKLLTTYGEDGGASQEPAVADADEEGAGENGSRAASTDREQV